MRLFSSLNARLVVSGFLGFVALAACGCGGGETPYPVSGKVTSDGAALNGGTVSFTPNDSKGNKTKQAPGSKIGSDGTYSLVSGNKSGAPLGWYKVTIVTDAPGETPSTVKVNPKYKSATSTDLEVEVVANPEPGKYDLKASP